MIIFHIVALILSLDIYFRYYTLASYNAFSELVVNKRSYI